MAASGLEDVKRRPVRGLPAVYWALWFGTVANRLGTVVQPFLAIYLVQKGGLDVAGAGRVLGVVGLGSLAAGPIGGALGDRLGRATALGLTTSLAALAMIALGFSHGTVEVCASAFAVGLFGAMYGPICGAIIADVVPREDRPRAYALRYWGANIGFAVAPALAGLLATESYSTLFFFDAVTTLILGGAVIPFLRKGRPAASDGKARSLRALASPYRHRAFLTFSLISALVMLVNRQVVTTLPLDIRAHSIGTRELGLLLGLNGAAITLLQPLVSRLTHGARRVVLLSVGALLTGVGFGLPGLVAPSIASYAVGIVVWTLGEMLAAGATPSLVADFSSHDLQGSYQGAFQLGWGLAGLAAPVIGTFVMAHFGAAALWRACLVAGLVAGSAFLLRVREPGAEGSP
jgi:MFS family permease